MRIETTRLIITEFTMDMAETVHLNSPDVDNRRLGSYPVTLKDGTYIGYVQAVPSDDGTWEIGYHIDDKFTNQGYATEAVTEFLPVIMKQIGITEMTGICLADNTASVKVMERCGFIKLYQGIGNYQGEEREICKFVYYLSPKDIVVKFFEDGYTNHNYDFVMNCMAEDYIDNSPAAARSNADAVGILKIVAGQFSNLTIKALENFKVENGKITESWGYWPDKEIEQKLKSE